MIMLQMVFEFLNNDEKLTNCEKFKVDHESDATAIAITLIKKTMKGE